MYKILIDRATIRKNPNAGKSVYLIPGKATYSVTIMNEVGEVIHEENVDNQTLEKLVEAHSLMGRTIHVKMSQNIQPVYSLTGEPDYLYDFLPTQITCEYCGEKFDYTELESDDGEDWAVYNVCPKCKICECCKKEYEKLTSELLHELGFK